MQSGRDVSLYIRSPNASSERRITPSWSISQLKTKLEPITGIPSFCQSLTLKLPARAEVPIEAQDEDTTQIGTWSLQPRAEIHVRISDLVIGYFLRRKRGACV